MPAVITAAPEVWPVKHRLLVCGKVPPKRTANYLFGRGVSTEPHHSTAVALQRIADRHSPSVAFGRSRAMWVTTLP